MKDCICIALKRPGLGKVNIPLPFLFERLELTCRSVGFSENGNKEMGPGCAWDDIPEERYVKFDVYVNVVNETIMNPRFREFAGTFVHIDPGVIRVAREANLETLRKKTDLKLGISELLEDLEADGDDIIWVTSVSRSKGCINAIVDGLRIEYIN
ncbi:AUREUSIDIN SYNTHASE-LIKE [Salix viminalis]|uniref:AUREUSIDIN SYNTHASE-LIKE n=1 Tax=Salix viminalis TaxID=40686 RepID=A0A9Q0QJL9_SALVM|nr:AUREUSIDIN SYNTHASE-LIKE [Salix viminalis]